MATQISRYDNLTTILVIGSMLMIFSMTKNLMDIYQPLALQALTSKTNSGIKGYTRPGQSSSDRAGAAQAASQKQMPIEGLTEQQNALVIQRFEQAIALMHAKQYDYAITALDQVLQVVPNMPEAYVNMGFAYLAMGDHQTAISAFEKAIDLRPIQVNAYYGLASAWDEKKDYEAALGAMRTYIHLSPADAPFLPKARAAIWEWEGLLGRIPGVIEAPEGVEPQIKQKYVPHSKPAASTKPVPSTKSVPLTKPAAP